VIIIIVIKNEIELCNAVGYVTPYFSSRID
jgi:hypothetical protein